MPSPLSDHCSIPSRADEARDHPVLHSVTLDIEGFGWTSLLEEAEREGLTVEELITFSVLYYLADVDSGRISRSISGSPYPGPPVENAHRSTSRAT